MTILGIETSCDETAISVIRINPPSLKASEGHLGQIEVLSNIVSSQVKLHAEFGGVVPNLAAREHVKNINHVFETALKVAGVIDFEKEVDLIAVTHGPGLGPALLVGISFAKTIAMSHNKPLVGVDHMRGHVYSNWLPNITNDRQLMTDNSKIKFPAMNLIVSGGHTELVLMSARGGSASGRKVQHDFQMVGETMDDAVGEAFDKVARLLGLGYPGGPAISARAEQFSTRLPARQVSNSPSFAKASEGKQFPITFPRPMIHSKDYNFSFSGLKTAVLYKIRDLKKERVKIDDGVINEIAHAFQDAAIDVLVQKTINAAQENGSVSVLLSGGVSANKLLRERLKNETEKNGLMFSCPPMAYTTDNAAMIALAGYFSYKQNNSADWRMVSMNANLGFDH